MSDNPPSRLPNGKLNPQYTRWYRRRNPSLTRQRDQLNYAKYRERNNLVRADEVRCLECSTVAVRENALLMGWRLHRATGIHRGICANCRILRDDDV